METFKVFKEKYFYNKTFQYIFIVGIIILFLPSINNKTINIYQLIGYPISSFFIAMIVTTIKHLISK